MWELFLYSSLKSMDKCHKQIHYLEKKILKIIYSQRKNKLFYHTDCISQGPISK